MGTRFEINIAYRGEHWGKLTLPQATTEEQAKARAAYLDHAMRRQATVSERSGDLFTITLTRWTETGREISIW